MLETLSVRPRICDQIRSGPLGRWVDDFVDVLMTRGYATGTVRACRRMSSATLPRCTCSRPASTWRPSRCGSATSDSKPPINTSRRTCNSRKTLCENSSRSVNERSGSRPTPRCWPSWRASDYDKQTTCWTPTATVSPTVTCHNAMLVILTETGLGSTARSRGRRRHRQANSVRVCSPTSRRVASLRARSAGLTALTPAPRTLVQTGSCRRCSLIHPLHVVVDVPSRMTLFRATADNRTRSAIPKQSDHLSERSDAGLSTARGARFGSTVGVVFASTLLSVPHPAVPDPRIHETGLRCRGDAGTEVGCSVVREPVFQLDPESREHPILRDRIAR